MTGWFPLQCVQTWQPTWMHHFWKDQHARMLSWRQLVQNNRLRFLVICSKDRPASFVWFLTFCTWGMVCLDMQVGTLSVHCSALQIVLKVTLALVSKHAYTTHWSLCSNNKLTWLGYSSCSPFNPGPHLCCLFHLPFSPSFSCWNLCLCLC